MREKPVYPDFLIIPYQVISDPDISATGNKLYGVIYWLTQLSMKRCTASNEYFAELLGVEETTIQRSLEDLERKGYITRHFTDKERRNRTEIEANIKFGEPHGRGTSNRTDAVREPRGRGHIDNTYKVKEIDTSVACAPQQVFRSFEEWLTEAKGAELGETYNDGTPYPVWIVGGKAQSPARLKALQREFERQTGKVSAPTPKTSPRAVYGPTEDVFRCFEKLNPMAVKIWSKNKTQKAAAENLLDKLGIEKIRGAVNFYIKHCEDEFVPQINSPFDLAAKYSKLVAFKKRLGGKGPITGASQAGEIIL